MAPPMPRRLVVSTPGAVSVDPTSGLERTAPATVTPTRAWLSQATTIRSGFERELNAEQSTVLSVWRLLCPISVPITSASTVADEQGRQYQVVGEVAA